MAIGLPGLSAVMGASPTSTGSSGSGTAYGTVPNPIAMPNSTYSQVGNVLPGLPGMTKSAGNVVSGQLSGQVSPETTNFLQQMAAQYGVASGMPGAGLQTNNLLRTLGITSEQQQQQGVQNYNSLTSNLASQQLSPETQTNVATQNAVWAAAPDPALAAQQQIATTKDLYSWEQAQQQQQFQNEFLWEQQHTPQGGTGGAAGGGWTNPTPGSNAWIARNPGAHMVGQNIYSTPYAAGV